MKILAYDVSKTCTGRAFYNGKDFEVKSFYFKNSAQWEKEIKEDIKLWKPDAVVYSDTVFFRTSHKTKKMLFGLFFLLEHICLKLNVSVVPIGDSEAKKNIDIKFRKREDIKRETMKIFPFANEDEADACSFAKFLFDTQ